MRISELAFSFLSFFRLGPVLCATIFSVLFCTGPATVGAAFSNMSDTEDGAYG